MNDGGSFDDRSAGDETLRPNRADIDRHLYVLFDPKFVHDRPDAHIEIAIANMAGSQKPDRARQFSVFDLQKAGDFAEERSKEGDNVFVGPALRSGMSKGRASKADVVTAYRCWSDFDAPGDDARVDRLLKERNLQPSEVIETGRTPNRRLHLYVRTAGKLTSGEVQDANRALKILLGGDDVDSPDHLMRLAGTINYPTTERIKRGYIPELVTLHVKPDAPAYTIEQLTGFTRKQLSQAATSSFIALPSHGARCSNTSLTLARDSKTSSSANHCWSSSLATRIRFSTTPCVS